MQFTQNAVVVNGPPDEVFAVAEAKGRFAEFVPHVLSSEEFEREGRTFVRMTARMKTGTKSRWVSLLVHREKNRQAIYAQAKGFCRVMGGRWSFEETPKGVRITLTHHFDVGRPVLKFFLRPFVNIDRLVRACVEENSQQMLEAIKRRVESRTEVKS